MLGKFNPVKLQTNLKLAMQRFKILTKKKTEETQKARREISTLLKAGRIESARIKVEHVIREDYIIEAMEILELYCDLLQARMGLIKTMSYCEDSLVETVSTLIWVKPRLMHNVNELNEISIQLEKKFGKVFAEQAASNRMNSVNEKIIHRMGLTPPTPLLIEKYLETIASNFQVTYIPDPTVTNYEYSDPEYSFTPKNTESAMNGYSVLNSNDNDSLGATPNMTLPSVPRDETVISKPQTIKDDSSEEKELDDLMDRFNTLKKK